MKQWLEAEVCNKIIMHLLLLSILHLHNICLALCFINKYTVYSYCKSVYTILQQELGSRGVGRYQTGYFVKHVQKNAFSDWGRYVQSCALDRIEWLQFHNWLMFEILIQPKMFVSESKLRSIKLPIQNNPTINYHFQSVNCVKCFLFLGFRANMNVGTEYYYYIYSIN